MRRLRVGLIGAGGISRTYMAAFSHVSEGEVVAVWSRQRENAERFASRFDLGLATDRVEELLAEVDVVCVNSPNACHASHAIAAARAGKHVIVEKPLAVSLEEGQAIIDACAEAGVGLAYAEELVFVPKFERAREILESGAIGEILYVTQREAHGGPYSPWFFTREEAGGGVLMDMACHAIELVRWVLGKPSVRRVTAHVANALHRDKTELEDHSVTHLEFGDGSTATCEASWVLQGGMQSRLELWGTEGHLDVDLLHGTGIELYTHRGSPQHGAPPGWTMTQSNWIVENGYPQELSHFLRCFQEGTPPRESGEDGLVVLEILLAAYESAATGRSVALPHRPSGVERLVDPWLRSRG
jgi:predicted dehydrogenase